MHCKDNHGIDTVCETGNSLQHSNQNRCQKCKHNAATSIVTAFMMLVFLVLLLFFFFLFITALSAVRACRTLCEPPFLLL